MGARVALSVTIVTLNEERNLGRCLRSVAWADEVVVVDSGSTDRTAAIAQDSGARFVSHPWPGYAAQKNHAASLAAHPWILSLDADEWLEPDAEGEIRAALASPRHVAYAFRRLSALSGGFVPHAWSPDRQIRLYRKDGARFGGGHVHESVRVPPPGSVGRLATPLLHLTHRDVHAQVARLNDYSALASRTAFEEGRRFSLVRTLTSPAAAFVKSYLVKAGMLDGVRGLIVAVNQAHYVFLKGAKLWDRERPRDAEFERRVPKTAEDPEPGAPYSG